ncbi:type II secretion system F family protein [Nocardiopsis oceani]
MAAVTLLTVCLLAAALLWSLPPVGRYRLAAVLPRGPRRQLPRPSFRELIARRNEAAERRRAVIVLCRVMAAELRAGQPPELALRVAALEVGHLAVGVSTPGSLHRAAERDEDLSALAYVAVCWEVASETGAGLAGVVDELADSLTEREEQRAEVAAKTAGPRMTALLLSGLPVVGLAMSAGLGGSPLVFLFTTSLGLACLVCGAFLDLAGAWWTLRMVRGAVA